MDRFHLTVDPGPQRFIQEWDELASLREEQKSSQRDYSYHNVLKPAVLEALEMVTRSQRTQVVDIGCGTGDLTAAVSMTHDVVGIDASPKSIAIAAYSRPSIFVCSSAEDYARDNRNAFNVAIANMVLMDSSNLYGLVAAAHGLLVKDGVFIATITHPWGWPHYCGYETADWFSYSSELFIESPWKISSEPEGASALSSTHVHRPLEAYFDAMFVNDFSAERIVELGMTTTGRYGQELKFAVPKFLLLQMRAR